ncbi:hypothetical protein OG607_03770 [Streptomyces sp. NBC_01537]|uniref:hypothetical protein n=1 Tax=Streptomyces sp. NBC_01537 TaxID=2903896 RepID=UPI00386370AD
MTAADSQPKLKEGWPRLRGHPSLRIRRHTDPEPGTLLGVFGDALQLSTRARAVLLLAAGALMQPRCPDLGCSVRPDRGTVRLVAQLVMRTESHPRNV